MYAHKGALLSALGSTPFVLRSNVYSLHPAPVFNLHPIHVSAFTQCLRQSAARDDPCGLSSISTLCSLHDKYLLTFNAICLPCSPVGQVAQPIARFKRQQSRYHISAFLSARSVIEGYRKLHSSLLDARNAGEELRHVLLRAGSCERRSCFHQFEYDHLTIMTVSEGQRALACNQQRYAQGVEIET